MSSNSNRGNGLSLAGVLTVVFVVLKLCNLINWSWIWVLSPIWISLALLGIVLVWAVCSTRW